MSSAANLYHSVINDVISSVRDSFLDESVDENVLMELKQLWLNKLEASKTIDSTPNPTSDAKSSNSTGGGAAAKTSQMRGSAGSGTAMAPTGNSQQGQQQIVITDPNRLVPVQITIPAQPGNPNSQPRSLTVQVPAHALQAQGSSSALLQQVLTQAITQALALPESHAAVYLQSQIDNTFKLNK